MTAGAGPKVLVTGAGGLVGHAVASRLVMDGARVTAVTRDSHAGLRTLPLDLAREPWPAEKWDVIVHCAARLPMRFEGPEAEAACAENRVMDDRALDAAEAGGAHLVYISTASLYGNTTGDISEATTPAPELGYAREKLATERAMTARGVQGTVFRLVAPYGPRQRRPTVLRRFLDLALGGAPLRYYGSGSRTQDFLHVEDVAAAVSLAVLGRVPGLFLLASGTAISMRDLAHLVVQATGSRSPVEAAGVPDPEEGRNVRYQVGRLSERLGFRPAVTLLRGVTDWALVRRAEMALEAAR